MTDQFSIGHSNRTTTKVLRSKLGWILTTGQFSTDQQLYGTLTVAQEEKIKSPRFAFLKIFASAHCTHLQSTHKPSHSPSLAKECNFASAQGIGGME